MTGETRKILDVTPYFADFAFQEVEFFS